MSEDEVRDPEVREPGVRDPDVQEHEARDQLYEQLTAYEGRAAATGAGARTRSTSP